MHALSLPAHRTVAHAPDSTKSPDTYHQERERTLRLFEEAGIAAFPATPGTKGTRIAGWPNTMSGSCAFWVRRVPVTRRSAHRRRAGEHR